MPAETYQLNTENGTKLAMALFTQKQPKAVVQITHGALEYKERYFDFAQFLQDQGYAVILSDNRGHGGSTSEQDPFGMMHSFDQIVADQVAVSAFAKGKYPEVPLYLYGHSFGSIIARAYLQKHDNEINKLLLTGTANYIPVVPMAKTAGKIFHLVKSEGSHSRFLNKLSGNLGMEHDWLSNNPENNQRAKEDNQMVPSYPVKSLMAIWEGDLQLKAFDRYQCQNPELPIYSLVGAEDVKITGGPKGLADTIATLRKIGYQDVRLEELPGMKHEILNEIDNQMVYQKILNFFEA